MPISLENNTSIDLVAGQQFARVNYWWLKQDSLRLKAALNIFNSHTTIPSIQVLEFQSSESAILALYPILKQLPPERALMLYLGFKIELQYILCQILQGNPDLGLNNKSRILNSFGEKEATTSFFLEKNKEVNNAFINDLRHLSKLYKGKKTAKSLGY